MLGNNVPETRNKDISFKLGLNISEFTGINHVTFLKFIYQGGSFNDGYLEPHNYVKMLCKLGINYLDNTNYLNSKDIHFV